MHLYSHGGVLFWMISSSLFALFYAVVLALPVLPCKRWITPPNQKQFYHYMFFMLVLYIVQVNLKFDSSIFGPDNLKPISLSELCSQPIFYLMILGCGLCNALCSRNSRKINRNVLFESDHIFLRRGFCTYHVLHIFIKISCQQVHPTDSFIFVQGSGTGTYF